MIRAMHIGRRPLWVLLLFPLLLLLFNACTSSDSSNGAIPSQAVLESGRVLYAANCQACHGDRLGAGRSPLAPPHGPDGHTWHHPDGQLKEIILDGTALLRESRGLPPSEMEMPPYKSILTLGEVDAVLAYIKMGWTQEQRDSQAKLSEQ